MIHDEHDDDEQYTEYKEEEKTMKKQSTNLMHESNMEEILKEQVKLLRKSFFAFLLSRKLQRAIGMLEGYVMRKEEEETQMPPTVQENK